MSEELNESQRALQELDTDSYYNISGLISKLQLGNIKYQNLKEKRLRQERERKRSARQAKRQFNAEKPLPEDEDDDINEPAVRVDRYAEEERIRRQNEANITKSAADYVKQKNANISIEIDVDDVDSDQNEGEENEIYEEFDRDLYLLIENAFFPPKSKSKNVSKGNNISNDINQIDFAFLDKSLDESTNKFMLNVLFGDAFKKINHEQSKLADQSLKKCVTEKTMGRFKLIGTFLEGAANQEE